MNFQPLGKRVLVERLEDVKTTATGIIIPDNAKEKPLSGSVLAVSSEVENVKVGDNVVFGKYAGTEITLDAKTYLVLNIDDVLGVIKK
ncbi:co-chaperone GroES [Campylobacter sp.]|uniref:co-chaperone GroES n=1 Tax=Campylobacter sp. TaxID=205 RepID=UPI00270C7E29|nr:co-chaperone GroES [Campylobacter sp.]